MQDDPSLKQLPVCDVLTGFEEEDRRVLSSYGKFLVFMPSETVIHEKDNQNSLYFVIRGALNAVHKIEDRPVPIGTIKEGEWFGEINIFDPHKASAAVVAKLESHVWRMSRIKLEEFLNDNPSLGCLLLLGVAQVMARRTRELVAKLNATWELSW